MGKQRDFPALLGGDGVFWDGEGTSNRQEKALRWRPKERNCRGGEAEDVWDSLPGRRFNAAQMANVCFCASCGGNTKELRGSIRPPRPAAPPRWRFLPSTDSPARGQGRGGSCPHLHRPPECCQNPCKSQSSGPTQHLHPAPIWFFYKVKTLGVHLVSTLLSSTPRHVPIRNI